ncbi:MAG TPA: hypothetical protein VEZ13_10830, partial [Brevibacillus sp.]|nr:hypothetical protein [Brevibacillus sp.]
MHLDHELEYFNLVVWLNRKTLYAMLQALVEVGVGVSWRETPEKFHLTVNTTDGRTEWVMERLNGSYRLH